MLCQYLNKRNYENLYFQIVMKTEEKTEETYLKVKNTPINDSTVTIGLVNITTNTEKKLT